MQYNYMIMHIAKIENQGLNPDRLGLQSRRPSNGNNWKRDLEKIKENGITDRLPVDSYS